MRTTLAVLLASLALADTPGTIRFPNAHGDRLVFSCEGDLWVAPLAGGEARRLTSAEGKEHHATFSPDGKWIAFTGEYEGNADVYVIPSEGGAACRLTWNPEPDRVVGWHPSGKVAYRARGELAHGNWVVRLVAPGGGDPEDAGLGEAMQASWSADGRVALVAWMWENQHWKRYSGGLAADIWVGKDKQFTRLTNWKGNDAYPMWHGERLYYLTDRSGSQNVWSVKPDGSDAKQHTKHSGYDVRFPSLGDGRIAYQFGADAHVLDLATGESRAVGIRLPSDRLQARAKRAEPADHVERFGASPDGTRLLAGARGEIFTLPHREGRIVNLTRTPGARERAAAWSPDGTAVACLSDASGEYEIWILDPEGVKPARRLTEGGTGWKLNPVWSPDSKWIAWGDMRGELWRTDAKTGKSVRVDHSDVWEISEYAWSHDARFLAFSVFASTFNGVIRIHDVEKGSVETVTDARWHSFAPAWDPEGRFLAFLSARTVNPHSGDYLFEYNFGVDQAVKPYVLRLKAGDRAPFEPRERGLVKEEKAPKKRKKVEIEWEGLSGRIVEVPVRAGNFRELSYVKGRLVWVSVTNLGWAPESGGEEEPEKLSLEAYDLDAKKKRRLAKSVEGYAVAPGGERLVVQHDGVFTRMDAGADAMPAEADANYRADGWAVPVEPEQEWRQIFGEVWRLERDFFYDPHHHGADWAAVRKKYEELLPRVASRDELNDLIGEMLAELSNSHAYIGGGDERKAPPGNVGSLGARLRPDGGLYRIERIFRSDPWDPKVASPLPAAGVREGDYLVAIDGTSVRAGDGWQRLLEGKAGKPVLLSVSSKADGSDARDAYLVPLASESRLLYRDWVESNRRFVAEKTGGRVGYLHVPDMGGAGLVEFTRQFFWQAGLDALVVDVRYNSGGNTHGMILDRLRRSTTHFDKPRHFGPEPVPWRSVRGHLVCVMNHDTASDGENFVHAWKHHKLGPVVGTRSWGGLVGYRGDKDLVDGGFNAQPEYAHYGWDGQWIVEGVGATPDIEVANTPGDALAGKDPQLERAIEEALKALERDDRRVPETPAWEERAK